MKALRFSLIPLVLMLAIVSAVWLGFNPVRLFSAENLHQAVRYAAGFFPLDLSSRFLSRIGVGALETFAISAVGTMFAAGLGLAIALPAASRSYLLARLSARFVLNVLRSVPELVWGAIMVLAAGLGPFAGALALTLHTTGVLGRLFAETLENTDSTPNVALREAGAGAVAAFLYGTWPTVTGQFTAYTLYRWEINLRMAAILGFVGAGGLGQMLYQALSLFQFAQAASIIAAMLVLAILVDAASAGIRGRLSGAH